MASTFKQTKDISFFAEAQLSGTGVSYSSGFDVSAYSELCAFVKVTAIGGTSPSLAITVQHSPDDVSYFDHSTMAAITATGNYYKSITEFAKWARLKYDFSGTSPTIDMTIAGVVKT